MRSYTIFFVLLATTIVACQQGTTTSKNEETESLEQIDSVVIEAPNETVQSVSNIVELIAGFKQHGRREIPEELSQKYFAGQYYTMHDVISAGGPLLAVVVSQTYMAASFEVYTFTSDGQLLDSKVLLSSEGGDIYHYKFETLSDRSFVLHRILDLTLYEDTTDGPMSEEQIKSLNDQGNIESYCTIDPNGKIKEFVVFGLGKWDPNDTKSKYNLAFTGEISGFDLICLSKRQGCTDIMCGDEMEFFLIKDGSIIHRTSAMFNTEGSPTNSILHDTFVQYLETKHVWTSDEGEAMTFDKKDDFIGGMRFVLKDGKLIQLNELSKTDLRIFRNLIFAKYGYKFKSDDLKAHFSTMSWYRPEHDNVDAMLSDEDKELAAYLKNLEDQS